MRYQVLIIDDEIFMCEALKQVIHKYCSEYEVVDIAYNGIEGLRHVENRKKNDLQYDLIFTDIRMPKMDGLKFLKSIREKGINTPVIIITGHSEFEYSRTALRLGATDYILKPLDRNEIREVLDHLTEQMRKVAMSVDEDVWEKTNNRSEMIQSMLEYMEQYYMEDLSISFFSGKTNFNPSYLSRIFKLETGKGFIQQLIDIRIKHAQRLLVTTGLHASEIGEKVGYSDKNHFGKIFKKEIGLPPGVYREQMNRHST